MAIEHLGTDAECRPTVYETVQSDPILDEDPEGGLRHLGHVAVPIEIPADACPPAIPGSEIYIG